MHLLQAQPMLTYQVAEPSNVLHPVALEVDRAILSSLENCPPTSIYDLVTEHIKWFASVRQDVVQTGHIVAPVQGI